MEDIEYGQPIPDVLEEFEKLDNCFEVINNFKFIRKHITKFGVTKEFLHLTNANGLLSNALDIEISDDPNEVDQVSLEGFIDDKVKNFRRNIFRFYSLGKKEI